MTAAINHAREHRQSNLLLDVTSLTGFKSPSLASRFYFMEEWARAARAFVRVAMVAPAAMIDPRKFGITVAANNNLTANVFTSNAEALASAAQSAMRGSDFLPQFLTQPRRSGGI